MVAEEIIVNTASGAAHVRHDFTIERETFARDGVVKLAGLLDDALLRKCEDCFTWSLHNPGPLAHFTYKDTDHQHHVDNFNPAAIAMYHDLVSAPVFAETLSAILGSEHVWYFAEEIFFREGGKAGRSPWHQDTAYIPIGGRQWANLWISFEKLPPPNALEVVRGSHLGPRYDGSDFKDPATPASPLHGGDWQPLPDIERDRAADPASWDVAWCAIEPGDVLMLHPHSLHGGAPVDSETPTRRTLVLRFFGDDGVFRPLGVEDRYKFLGDELFEAAFGGLAAGAHLRSPCFKQIR
jgi:hypothetical protein